MTNRNNAELWERIQNFKLDSDGDKLTFSQRLGRDNAWSLSYARRVIDEYKKFVYLAMTAGQVVTPSEQVDEAWHLHLLYTESYWNDFCANVLGSPLHHSPTRGGSDEHAKHYHQYERTITSYLENFGAPPADIWPYAKVLFPHAATEVRSLSSCCANKLRVAFNLLGWKNRCGKALNKLRQITSPSKFIFLITSAISILSAKTAIAAPNNKQLGWNVFDWQGRDYLELHIPLTMIMVAAAFVLRIIIRRAPDDRTTPELSPYETAYLSGGDKRLMATVITSLVQRGHLNVDRITESFTSGESLPRNAHPIDEALFNAAQRDGTFKNIWNATEENRLQMLDSLQKLELIQTNARSWTAQILSALVAGSPLLIGIPKVMIGIDRNKPTTILFFVCFINFAVIALPLLLTKQFRTSKGNAVLNAIRSKYQLDKKVTPVTMAADPLMVGMMVGLFGTTLLSDNSFADVQSVMHKRMRGSEFSGSGCGGGGCGGGGCGAGECGGGCGGCGGGD